MKLVYIAHPYTTHGDPVNNLAMVTAICQQVAASHPDVVPVSSIHAFAFMNPNGCQEMVLKMCRELLNKCDEIWLFGEWWQSYGCQQEAFYAMSNGIPCHPKTSPPLTVVKIIKHEESDKNVYN